jgi:hypothetical protein
MRSLVPVCCAKPRRRSSAYQERKGNTSLGLGSSAPGGFNAKGEPGLVGRLRPGCSARSDPFLEARMTTSAAMMLAALLSLTFLRRP